MTLIQEVRAAMAAHEASAVSALSLFRNYCGGVVPPRVPGMDTVIRMALRIGRGYSIEQAAAKEYVYRWHLAILAPDQCRATGRRDWADRDPHACVSVFGQPHTLGM